MANLHEQFISGSMDVHHKGETKKLALPSMAIEFSKVLQDEDRFVEVLKKHNKLLAFLHLGVQQYAVGFRAHNRPGDDESIMKITSEHSVLYSPQVQNVPKVKKEMSLPEMIATLKAQGMSKEDIKKEIEALL